VFVGIGAIIAISAVVQQNMEVTDTDVSGAEAEFEKVRQQFPDRPPLLDFKDGQPSYAAGRPDPARPRTDLQTLHVVAWDPDDKRLAKFAIPFWLLRFKATPIEFSSYASGLDDNHVNLRVEEVERYGAGIILDAAMPSGERVLLWAQ
jgi:hypothetical protein